MRSSTPLTGRLIRIAMLGCLILGSCATEPEEPEAAETATGTASEAEAVEVIGRDYSYDGVPAEMEAGTELTLTNESDEEVHEIVAFRLPDAETRSAEELVQLPQAELEQALGGPPATVIVALPAEEGQVVEGDGTLPDAGRYIFLCFVPTGADPAAFEEAIANQSEEAPDVEGGPPHFTQGMYAESTVS